MKQMGCPILNIVTDLGGEVAGCFEFCDALIDEWRTLQTTSGYTSLINGKA